jgi:DNA-binding transcriptional MerR regulator
VESPKLRIGQLAARVGVATSALRYYEDAGLLGPGERTDSGYRLYGIEALGRLEFIRRAKALGLRLDEIRRLVDGPHADSDAERQALRHLVAHKIAETRSRTEELQRLDSELRELYTRLLRTPGPECGHVGDCACWLPTKEEVIRMTQEVACCQQACCPDCSCTKGEPCDCSGCACSTLN